MADYLRSELLAQLPTERAVLGAMEDANLLLVPLDRRRRWYRYHQPLRELLLAELERQEPELIPRLHSRAAAWNEANDRAGPALAGGDPARGLGRGRDIGRAGADGRAGRASG